MKSEKIVALIFLKDIALENSLDNRKIADIQVERLKKIGVDQVLYLYDGVTNPGDLDAVIFKLEKNVLTILDLHPLYDKLTEMSARYAFFVRPGDIFPDQGLYSEIMAHCGDMVDLIVPCAHETPYFVFFRPHLLLELAKEARATVDLFQHLVAVANPEKTRKIALNGRNSPLILDNITSIRLIQFLGGSLAVETIREKLRESPSLSDRLKSVKVELMPPDPSFCHYLPPYEGGEAKLEIEDLKRLIDDIFVPGGPILELGIYGQPHRWPHFPQLLELLKGVKNPGRARLSFSGHGVDKTMMEQIYKWPFQALIFRMEQPVGVPSKHPTIKVISWVAREKAEFIKNTVDFEKSFIVSPIKPQLVLEFGLTQDWEANIVGLARKWDYRSQAVSQYHAEQGGIDKKIPFYNFFYANFPPVEKFVIRQYSSFGGRVDAKRCMDCTPIKRFKCTRISEYLTLNPDGKWAYCPQDFSAQESWGSIKEMGPWELWFKKALIEERNMTIPGGTHCRDCDIWHQPWA